MNDEMFVSGTPAFCSHCGKLTIFMIRAEYVYELDERNYVSSKIMRSIKWSILQCSECLKPIFMQASELTKPDHSEHNLWRRSTATIEILYPSERQILPNLPETIGKMYSEAVKVSTISPSSCAVLVRRTLEAVCHHENVPGRTLAEELRQLANTGKIPLTLVNVAFNLKQLGNLGAHLDINDDVSAEDVPIILDFIELFLEYLYVAPAKLQAVEDRLRNPRRVNQLAPTNEED